MHFKIFSSILFALIFHICLFAQDKTITYLWDGAYTFEDREIDLYHLNANLEIKPWDTLVIGEVEYSFKTLREKIDSIVFEIPEISVKEVKIDGEIAVTKNVGTKILIFPPHELTWQTHHKILFIYTAKPTEGLYFVGWNDPAQIKRKQIWAHRPNHWLPYAPAIQSVDMSVTVPADLKVFSNGVRMDVVTNKDNTKTWIYKMNHPHPFFSTCLVIGDYNFKTLTTKRGLPVELWYYPDWESHFDATYLYQKEMFDFFEQEMDFNYPWEIYRQAPVIDYMYGAMETTTSTIFGDYLMVDERGFLGRNYVNVDAHELSHQWFGNYISHLKNKDVWLTESFATYWAKMFEKHIFGEDYFQEVRKKELDDVFAAARRNNFSVGHSSGGRERVYSKGALVLEMLHDILGDLEFKAVMKYYLEENPYQTAETNDFLQAIREVTGRSMEWFFEQWIYRGGEPEFKISYETLIHEGKAEVRVYAEQIQPLNDLTGLFKVPVAVEVHFSDGSIETKTQWISAQWEQLMIENPENRTVDFVVFDPNRKIIKKVNFERSYDELVAQAEKSANMIDRYDALVALKSFSVEQKKEDLLRIYNEENFHLTKGEIISQLVGENDEEIQKLILSALNDKDDKVRLAVLQNVPVVSEAMRENYERLLKDKSYLNLELALENLCNSFPERYGIYLDRTADETGWRGRNVRIKWLEIALEHGGKAYAAELKKYAGESYEFETRINAMHAFQRLNMMDSEIADNLLSMVFHWNYKISNAARGALVYFYKQSIYKEIIRSEIQSGNYSQSQLEKLSGLLVD